MWIPLEIGFHTKPEIALQQIRAAVDRELPQAPVLPDAYGNDTKFREGITESGLLYAVAVQSSVATRQAPLPKRKWKGITPFL
jgi:SRSO17 transposase